MSKILLVQPALPLLALLLLRGDPTDRTASFHRMDVLRDPVHPRESSAERHSTGRTHLAHQHSHVLLYGAEGNRRVC